MIKFRCSGCQKAIGVDEKFADRLIKCPSCENATRVPSSAAEEMPVAQAIPVAETANQQAFEATTAHVPKVAVNPLCPSCQTELFNPSDTMCGICGHLLEQAAVSPQANKAASGTSPNIAAQLPPATATLANPYSEEVDEDALPVNPALGDAKYADPCEIDFRKPVATSAKATGAWIAAVALGLFLALIWGVIASFTGPLGQVFAWAIGAIVGLIAGLIARSRSIRFCLATTFGALLCMLFGRIVSAWVIVASVSTMGAFSTFLMPDNGVTIGVMEDMNANGEFEGEEKDLAAMRVKAFFENKDITDVPEYDETEFEVELELDKKVREVVREMSFEEKQELLKKVREDHPDWMDQSWHYDAVLDSMVVAGEIEDEGLLAHANSKLAVIDGEYDQKYFMETPQSEMTKREEELRQLVKKKFAEMDSSQRDEAVRNARINHPAWTPVFHEFLAMLDSMYESGEIPKELKKLAKSNIRLNLELEFDDTYIDGEDIYAPGESEEEKEQAIELQTLVNKELMKLSQDDIDKLVESTKVKYPDWQPVTEFTVFEDLSGGFDDVIDGFDSDGTFWGSLKTRFKTMDFVWLSLGMLSAFVFTFTLGRPNEPDKAKS